MVFSRPKNSTAWKERIKLWRGQKYPRIAPILMIQYAFSSSWPDLSFETHFVFFAQNYFPNPAGRPKLFSESCRPSEFIFPNPAGRSFFPNPADRKMSVRKFLSEKCPFENFGSIDSIIHSIRSILVELTSGDRPENWIGTHWHKKTSVCKIVTLRGSALGS